MMRASNAPGERLCSTAAVRILALVLCLLGLATATPAQTIREVRLGNGYASIVISIDGPFRADTVRQFRPS